ncbi:DNA repair exonuclease [Bacillus sp. 03113]|uniref:metallophosphoesterase family protein n=1 Tax=Bacillus sp. 03113 TaxID=2578211 RepID=UPI001143B7DC|nr:DNA repair exonuclease [Bacillus sp. 03113]
MKRITFIHAADLHLDSPMIGLKELPSFIRKRVQESTFVALKKVVEAAILHKVDFVIIAGDLYDEEDRSIRAQTRFRQEMTRLAKENISVFLVHGNHDYLTGDWVHLSMPDNVYIFQGHVEKKNFANHHTSVHLYGFSYDQRHVIERKIDQYQKVDGADFHIGILHGYFEGGSEHGRYAPFQLSDLVEKKFDYWALGHIHKRSILSKEPPIIYPGNIQGRHKKEEGIKGCYLVTIDEVTTHLQFIETSDIVWRKLELDVEQVTSFNELYSFCKKAIEKERSNKQGILMSLILKNVKLEGHDLKAIVTGELMETLQDEEKEEDLFVWIFEIAIQESFIWTKETLIEKSDFYSELFNVIDEYDGFDQSLAPLLEHHQASRFIETVSEEEKKERLTDAQKLLIQLLNEH